MATTGDQLPGCTIPEKCMLNPDHRPARRDIFCGNDLKCVCKVDNHLGNNCMFSNECLLKECTDGHERKLFLRDWLESCRQVGRSGWDNMPSAWEPYLPSDGEVPVRPTSLVDAPPATTASKKWSSVAVVTSTAAVATSIPLTSLATLLTTAKLPLSESAPTSVSSPAVISSPLSSTAGPIEPVTVTVHSLSGGAIGGVVAGILFLALLCAGLGFFYWRATKRAKEKNKEVAILGDRVSRCGFQQRIDELLAANNSSIGATLRPNAPTPAGMAGVAGGSNSAVEVPSTSSSIYSIDIARAL